MFRCIIREQKGIAMPTVIALFSVITLLAFTAAFMVNSQSFMTERYVASVDAIHYAEAGIDHYLWHLNKENSPPPELQEDIEYENGFYRIETVDSGDGWEIIRSSGWAKGEEAVVRTVEVRMSKRSFTEYAYLSNTDGDDANPIWWVDGEHCYGPYHTNFTLRVWGAPIFHGRASYVNRISYYNPPDHIYKTNHSDPGTIGSNAPDFRGGIARVSLIPFPSNNTELLIQAQLNGYVYEGRTSILLSDNGTIITRNPYQVGDSGVLGEPKILPLPTNRVIYVNGVAGGHGNKFDLDKGNAFVSGTLNGRLTIAASNNIYVTGKDPTNYTFSSATTTGGIIYKTTNFSPIYSSGELVGYEASGGNDMLGLIANNNIWTLADGWFTTTGGSYGFDSTATLDGALTIHGAIFAINHSFGNETVPKSGYTTNYAWLPDPPKNLVLRGSLIQNRRGAVGVISDGTHYGYYKDYAHDPRMIYTTPPHFILPEESGWEVRDWMEISEIVELQP